MRLHQAMFAFCLMGAATPALAGTIENSFGNTITVTGPDGATARYYFDPDGSVVATYPNGHRLEGEWEVRGAQICLRAPEIEEECHALADDKNLGDEWSYETSGQTYTFAIVAGR